MRAARLDFRVCAAPVDEQAEKARLAAARPRAAETAAALAALKARRVSMDNPGIMTIGADQTLLCGDAMFDKPADLDQARDHLHRMSGTTHVLHSAVAVAVDGDVVWHDLSSATMTMRPLTPEEIDDYLAVTGDGILSSVGCYRLEDTGSRLFTSIDGDYFTILGLPLLPLLACLRDAGVID